MGKRWTSEEERYLANNWGTVTIDGLCRHLGRSRNAVAVKVSRLGLPPYFESGDYITVNQLHKAFFGSNFSSYQIKSWVENRALPVRNKKRGNYSARIIYLDEFWKWAEKNRSFLDFSKFEPLALGKEPDWVDEQRHKDFKAFSVQRKDPWTPAEDSRLRALLKQHKYGYAEISAMLSRSAGAIQRRCNDLGLMERPVKADNHGPSCKWTPEMYARLAGGIKSGESYSMIGLDIGKSEKAVRGKVYTVYLTEDADKVRAMMGNGSWGCGAPVPTVKQGVCLSGYRVETAKNLSSLVGLLRYRMNDLGFEPFWQRHMCLNWDDVAGCTANCGDCDACTKFRRISPQYCARCGGTFYERTENRFCAACRSARKKKAQRHWCRVNAGRDNNA